MSSPPLSRRGFVGTSLGALAGLSVSTPSFAAAESPISDAFRSPFIYPFRIGEVEAWSISDSNLMLGDGLGLMWPEEQRATMQTCLDAHGEPAGALPLYVNILVLRHGKEVILFDAGFGPRDNPRMGWLREGLALIGITPDQVTAGFLSHAHGDHIDGFINDGQPAFPNAAFHVLSTELAFWRGPNPDFSKSKRNQKPLPRMVETNREKFDILDPQTIVLHDGDELFGGLVRVEAAPGHTAGHACFRIRSGDDELLHLMDLAHHHLLMFADPTWTIAFDHDPEQSVVTRQKFWTKAAAQRTRCFGFHLPWPGIGQIVPQGANYQWWAEAWRWQT
jgi:glyoxylase-like metal-dependent hydrolase (beta-lactamase superfamily II)